MRGGGGQNRHHRAAAKYMHGLVGHVAWWGGCIIIGLVRVRNSRSDITHVVYWRSYVRDNCLELGNGNRMKQLELICKHFSTHIYIKQMLDLCLNAFVSQNIYKKNAKR